MHLVHILVHYDQDVGAWAWRASALGTDSSLAPSLFVDNMFTALEM